MILIFRFLPGWAGGASGFSRGSWLSMFLILIARRGIGSAIVRAATS